MGYNACTEETNWECYTRKGDLDASITYALPDRNLVPPVTLSPLSLERKLRDNEESLYHDSLTERVDY